MNNMKTYLKYSIFTGKEIESIVKCLVQTLGTAQTKSTRVHMQRKSRKHLIKMRLLKGHTLLRHRKYSDAMLFFFGFFTAMPVAYVSFQARGQIRAAAASLHCSPQPQQCWIPNPLRPGMEPESSWMLVGLVSATPHQELAPCF